MSYLLTEGYKEVILLSKHKMDSDMKVRYLILVTLLSISTKALAKKEMPVNRYM
jgi:hypothetical protein